MDALQTSGTHKLSELRAAGRAGWKDDYLFAEGRVLRIVALPSPDGANVVRIRRTSLKDDDALLQDGWSLLPQ